MIGYAVSSFPKQSLDEWIIDYPQQTILNTIHLILTHEINELFMDFKCKGLAPSDHSESEEEEMDSKIDSTRNAIQQEASRLTHEEPSSEKPALSLAMSDDQLDLSPEEFLLKMKKETEEK
jgi:hypothetical protein